MAHPFLSQVKSGSAAKYKALTGKKSSGQSHPDGGQDSKAKKMAGREYNVGGSVSAPSFARGGRTKSKKGTTINIAVIAGGKDKEEAPPMPMPMMPPMPKAPMAPPPGMDAPGAPGGMPTGGLPGMKRGGKVPMKAGAESGPGRLDKIKAYGKKS